MAIGKKLHMENFWSLSQTSFSCMNKPKKNIRGKACHSLSTTSTTFFHCLQTKGATSKKL
jgi:hypothetical protein